MKVIVVAGAQAGVGKTTFAVGLMAALRQRGLRVQGFKVGPDLLDPLLHEAATGRPSFNLDGWMLSREYNLACVSRLAADADVAVVEGGETLFDGDDDDERGSAGQIAKWLGAPVLLVVDCAAQSARSVAALLKGYLALRRRTRHRRRRAQQDPRRRARTPRGRLHRPQRSRRPRVRRDAKGRRRGGAPRRRR